MASWPMHILEMGRPAFSADTAICEEEYTETELYVYKQLGGISTLLYPVTCKSN